MKNKQKIVFKQNKQCELLFKINIFIDLCHKNKHFSLLKIAM